MMKSTIKWFNNKKGFGFIRYSETEDIFVHYTEIIKDGYKSLKENQEVEFDLIKTENGYQACNVRPISKN